MSPSTPQWISTVSMNRFYDHCYLVECAFIIINRYCCSFINLMNHDDGSIPYYLVQKVKIAVEYGKMLLNTRYRPFQQHLCTLGTYDFIDQSQFQSLIRYWDTIKIETQIVEMYFNQISLLIYPVVSSSTLMSLSSLEKGSVYTSNAINALIQCLSGCESMTFSVSPSSLFVKNSVAGLKTKMARPDYFTEDELGSFIINTIIEPLFNDDISSSTPIPDYGVIGDKTPNHYYNAKNNDTDGELLLVNSVERRGGAAGPLQLLRKEEIMVSDLCNLIGGNTGMMFTADSSGNLPSELLTAGPFGADFSEVSFRFQQDEICKKDITKSGGGRDNNYIKGRNFNCHKRPKKYPPKRNCANQFIDKKNQEFRSSDRSTTGKHLYSLYQWESIK